MVEVKMGILELGFSGAFQSGFLVVDANEL